MADEKFSQFADSSGTFDGSEKLAGLQTGANVNFTPQQIAGLAVQSVTGVNTDNTDPKNPIVKVATDNATITGQGTTGSPLVSNCVQSVTGLNTDNTDPKNPVVQISTGTGIGGNGTSGNPLTTTAPSKVYIAVLSQSGTSNPTIDSVLKNSFSGTITIVRSTTGSYNLNITTTEFTSQKTAVFFTVGLNQIGFMSYAQNSTSQILVSSRNISGSSADSQMQSTLIKIEVYS